MRFAEPTAQDDGGGWSQVPARRRKDDGGGGRANTRATEAATPTGHGGDKLRAADWDGKVLDYETFAGGAQRTEDKVVVQLEEESQLDATKLLMATLAPNTSVKVLWPSSAGTNMVPL